MHPATVTAARQAPSDRSPIPESIWPQRLPGLLLTAAIAAASTALAHLPLLQVRGIGALTLAILLGMLVGNTVHGRLGTATDAGVAFSKARLLRAGIVLYGLRLTFQDIGNVGWSGVLVDALVLCSTFGLACWLGTRVFGLDRRTAMLIGAGSSICGAAAVMAAEPVVRGRAEEVMVAVATVVVFGTLAMFLYPVLFEINARYRLVEFSETAFGIFTGSTVHEVAQVVAAGRSVSQHAANTAVIAKMVRVMMLAPFLLGLSAWIARFPGDRPDHAAQDSEAGAGGIVVPWFALGFVLVAGIHSAGVLPAAAVAVANEFDSALLAMAMAGLGLTTHLSAVRKAGVKPLALAAVLFAWLLCGGLAINLGVAALTS